jgi:hypothetical protein
MSTSNSTPAPGCENPSTEALLRSTLQKTAERQQQEADNARLAEELAPRAKELSRLYQELASAIGPATCCPEEEPLLALGKAFRAVADAEPEQKLWERLRQALSGDKMPEVPRYASMILLTAAEGNTTAVQEIRQKVSEDPKLGHYAEWFPSILHELWPGSLTAPDPPSGTRTWEYEPFKKAFHWPPRKKATADAELPPAPAPEGASPTVSPPSANSETEQERPALPTAEYCLLPPKEVRWQGPTNLRPQLWKLFQFLLSQKNYPVEQNAVENAVWNCKDNPPTPKRFADTVSELNGKLAEISFPWIWHVENKKVTREG